MPRGGLSLQVLAELKAAVGFRGDAERLFFSCTLQEEQGDRRGAQ